MTDGACSFEGGPLSIYVFEPKWIVSYTFLELMIPFQLNLALWWVMWRENEAPQSPC